MDSFFGFTGRHQYNQIIKYVTSEERDKIESIYPVIESFYIERIDKYYIRYDSIPNRIKCKQSNSDYDLLLAESNNKRYDLKEISLPAAIFIASYGIIKLIDIIINNPDYILNYDTDGLKITKSLKGDFIGAGLGQLKEDVKDINEGYFIASKFYALKLKYNRYILKGESIDNKNLNYQDYIDLYNNVSVIKNEERWYGKLVTGKVEIINLPIELSPELTKRKKVYSLGKWVGTDPFHVEDGIITTTALIPFAPEGTLANKRGSEWGGSEKLIKLQLQH